MEKKELSIFNAMKFLKDCFDEHAAKDGEKATMTKKELADLLRQQFEIVSKIIMYNTVVPESCECSMN